jgi:hypothetical protein
MRVNTLEVDVFAIASAVALARSHRSYEGVEEESAEEEPEEREPDEDEEEGEPEEILWKSATTFVVMAWDEIIVKGRQTPPSANCVTSLVPSRQKS